MVTHSAWGSLNPANGRGRIQEGYTSKNTWVILYCQAGNYCKGFPHTGYGVTPEAANGY